MEAEKDQQKQLHPITFYNSIGDHACRTFTILDNVLGWTGRFFGRVEQMRGEEGVNWIRGHHADDSPEVLAMLTSYALARGGFEEGAE